jgi:hypothetical protein
MRYLRPPWDGVSADDVAGGRDLFASEAGGRGVEPEGFEEDGGEVGEGEGFGAGDGCTRGRGEGSEGGDFGLEGCVGVGRGEEEKKGVPNMGGGCDCGGDAGRGWLVWGSEVARERGED